MSETVELRPLPPFLPPQARVIMMGSFPPAQEKRAMDFHYPNFNNDMWRVYGLIFFNDKDYFRKEGEKAFDAEKIKFFYQLRVSPHALPLSRLFVKRAMHPINS